MEGRWVKEGRRDGERQQERKERGRKERNEEIWPSASCNNMHLALEQYGNAGSGTFQSGAE